MKYLCHSYYIIRTFDTSGAISEASVQVQDESEDGASQVETIPCDNLRSPVSNKKQKDGSAKTL